MRRALRAAQFLACVTLRAYKTASLYGGTGERNFHFTNISPFKEGDLIVSFFTRDQGKLRGVARRARRPKNSFGAGLERLSHVKMSYYQRENRELVNLNSCEVLESQFGLAGEYAANLTLDYIAEVCENLLPAGEPSERFFRLLLAVLDICTAIRQLAFGRPSLISVSGLCACRASYRICE